MKLTGEILEPLSSKIDWCEPNYQYTVFVAEIWNTVSPCLYMNSKSNLKYICLYADQQCTTYLCSHVYVISLQRLCKQSSELQLCEFDLDFFIGHR